jgi:phenylalanyl-tRNA synthetase beta chain
MRLKKFSFKKISLPAFNNLIELYSSENKIGYIGELSRGVTDKMDVKDRLLVFEINLDMLYKIREELTSFRSMSKYPNILRDIAILADRKVESKVIEDFIKRQGTSLLKKLTLFDCYEGKSIPPGKKSLAYSLVFGDDERTLKDEEVDAIHENIIKLLADKFQAHLRSQ